MKIFQTFGFLILLTGLFCLGGCVTSAQLKSPAASTVVKKVNVLKTDRSALIAYLKRTDISYTQGPVDLGNQFWVNKFSGHAGLDKGRLCRGDSLVTFYKETFPFATPASLTATPFVDGQVVYDRNGRYLGSYITSGLTGM